MVICSSDRFLASWPLYIRLCVHRDFHIWLYIDKFLHRIIRQWKHACVLTCWRKWGLTSKYISAFSRNNAINWGSTFGECNEIFHRRLFIIISLFQSNHFYTCCILYTFIILYSYIILSIEFQKSLILSIYILLLLLLLLLGLRPVIPNIAALVRVFAFPEMSMSNSRTTAWVIFPEGMLFLVFPSLPPSEVCHRPFCPHDPAILFFFPLSISPRPESRILVWCLHFFSYPSVFPVMARNVFISAVLRMRLVDVVSVIS